MLRPRKFNLLRKFNLKKLGGVFVIVVLLCVGINYYAEWSNEHFASKFREPPQVSTSSEPAVETSNDSNDEVPPVEQAISFEQPEFVDEDTNTNIVVFDPEPVETPEPMDEETPVQAAELSESFTEFDLMLLLSEFELPEEVTSLLDENEDADEDDFEEAETYFVEEYGQSPEVEEIVDRLQQMSGSRVEIDPLTGLFESWVQLLPEEDQATHRELTDVIRQLHRVRALGGSGGPVRIEVRVLDPEAVRRLR